MSDRRARAVLLLLALPISILATGGALGAETAAVTILDLPFKARALRGPGSEVAVAAATSGLVPGARPGAAVAAGEEAADHAPVAVVWGEGGGAALSLVDGAVRATPLATDAVEGLVAAETPRGALPGIRRAVSGGLSAYLTGPTRAASGEGGPNASSLTVRERQPMGMSADPKPVQISTSNVPAGPDAVFAPRRPRATLIGGQPAFVAVTLRPGGKSALALVGRKGVAWGLVAEGALQEGGALKVAAVGDFAKSGQPQIAAVKAPDAAGTLQLWTVSGGALSLAAEAPGYAEGADDSDLAATVDRGGATELALPVADRSAVALVSLKGGIAERVRIPLPAPAGFGLAVLGKGAQARLLVGLADGRIAVAPIPDAKP